jgi:ethanolaminephosphotransferase
LNCTLASLLETAAMAFGSTKLGAFTALIPTLPMFFSTWETYHTHTLYLGYFNGPTEGLIIACSMMVVSGIYGPSFWTNPLVHWFPSLSPFIDETATLRDLWIPLILSTFFIAHLPFCVLNVYHARSAQGLPTLPLLLEWTPIIVFTASVIAWLGSPHSHLLSDNHLVLFCITMSAVFGRMTTKIILAHLTRQPFPYWTVMLVPLVGGAVLANLPVVGFPAVSAEIEHMYLIGYLVFAFVAYGVWAKLVVSSICNYLGINCLTIPRDKWQQSSNAILNGGPSGKKD